MRLVSRDELVKGQHYLFYQRWDNLTTPIVGLHKPIAELCIGSFIGSVGKNSLSSFDRYMVYIFECHRYITNIHIPIQPVPKKKTTYDTERWWYFLLDEDEVLMYVIPEIV